MLDIAVDAAKKAGERLSHYFEMTSLEREIKEDKSFATKADTESEEIIVSAIKSAFPEHGILGEEGTDHNPGAEYQWVIDPLDGTSNFVNGIPLFATSIGVLKSNEPFLGVVYNPVTNSLYAGERGKGVSYNGKPVTVSDQSSKEGLVTVGYGSKDKEKGRSLPGNSFQYFRSTRLLGCAALELAYVARGGTEGFMCLGLKKWDYAAGALLVQEAQGKMTDLKGGEWNMEKNYFVASNGIAHDDLLALAQSLSY